MKCNQKKNKFIVFYMSTFLIIPCFAQNELNNSNLYFVNLSSVSNQNFRGKIIDDLGIRFQIETSSRGFSAGINVDTTVNETGYLGFVSYSYATEVLIPHIGINYVDYFDTSQSELFFELTGREDYLGFSPSVYISKGLSESTTYGEIRIAKDYLHSQWLINPYLDYSFGKYYTNSFESNHFDIGIDATKDLGGKMYFSAFLAAVKPLGAIEQITNKSSVYIQGGVSLNFTF